MKRLKAYQNHGCYWCRVDGVKTPAIWREQHCAGKHACEKHREDLATYERKKAREDSHMSEADYQTWGRL